MANETEVNQKDLLNKLNKEGIPMSSESRYSPSVLEIVEIETTMTGPTAKYDYLKKWEAGQAIIIVHFKIAEGESQGGRFNILQGLFNKNGKTKAYRGFIASDGTHVPSSYLGEIIHRIKELDEGQWDKEKSELFIPENLIGCKFEIGVRYGENDKGSYYFAEFEKQIKKDEEYAAQQGTDEETDEIVEGMEKEGVFDDEKKEEPVKKATPKKTKKEVIIEADDLPF